ncbi:DrmB family protein [Chelativorans composti]|uniref:DrmB family protein n=2 Tax=Chelativorans composti TaxID=768533 RepID=A0ABW5DF66_9HYPH
MSQVVGLFGPGAMIDLPDRSVLVMGLDHWETFGPHAFETIEEPRLAQLLERRLADQQDGRISAGKPLSFRTPPIDQGDPGKARPAIKAKVFPEWFVCDSIDTDPPNRRRIVRFSELEAPKKTDWRGDDGRKRHASPLRFVCGCEKGHLQDIEWRRVVHATRSGEARGEGGSCRKAMWLEDTGTSADPRDTRIVCECGAKLSLEELFQPGRLGPCTGKRPWLASDDPDGCDRQLRLLTRSATNTYFPQVVRIISLPESDDALERALDAVWSTVASCASAHDVSMAKRFNPTVAANLGPYSDQDIFNRISARRHRDQAADHTAVENPRIAEFRLLASGRKLIGENRPDARLHAETLDREQWDPDGDPNLAGVRSLVAVHRLREVSCLYGFTRFEPAPLAEDGIEDVGLAVNGAPLGENPEWLPAIEQFGEGFFLRLDPLKLMEWVTRPAVRNRATNLASGAQAWKKARRDRGLSDKIPWEGEHIEYTLAHSLSHALINEVAIDCGYPASSLKERLYLIPNRPGEPKECGILIYTASAGNQGTLGGLVEVTRRFSSVMSSALERLRLCSGDPICADHDPATASEDRALHGAACHGCLLVAETSCEQRNVFLDRSLLVDTMATFGASFFTSNTTKSHHSGY